VSEKHLLSVQKALEEELLAQYMESGKIIKMKSKLRLIVNQSYTFLLCQGMSSMDSCVMYIVYIV